MTRFNRGVYAAAHWIKGSESHPEMVFSQRREIIKRISMVLHYSGILLSVTLKELIDENLNIKQPAIDRLLSVAKYLPDNKSIILDIHERRFKAKNADGTNYPRGFNRKGWGYFREQKGKRRTQLAYWNHDFATDIGMTYGEIIQELASKDPRFIGLTHGESTSLMPDNIAATTYREGLQRVAAAYRSATDRVYFTQPNFMPGGDNQMRQYLQFLESLGDVCTLPPDMLWCREPTNERCGPGCGDSKISAYGLMRASSLHLGAQFQNRDIHIPDHKRDIDFAVDVMKCRLLVIWPLHFGTKDTRSKKWNDSPLWFDMCTEFAEYANKRLLEVGGKPMPDKPEPKPPVESVEDPVINDLHDELLAEIVDIQAGHAEQQERINSLMETLQLIRRQKKSQVA